MRNGVIMGAAVVAIYLASFVFAGGVAAQDGAKRTELGEGSVLEGPRSSVEVWLEKPMSTGAQAELRLVGNPSGSSFSSTIAEAAREENDDLVPMALATFGVAVAAMVVGLAAYLLRLRLGLVQPPPAPEDLHESD